MTLHSPSERSENVYYDDLLQEALHERVLSWARDHQPPSSDEGTFTLYMQTIFPRTVFFKNLIPNSHIVDLGAGEGGLSLLKAWPSPTRNDLRLHAISLDKGQYFDNYEGYELGNFDKELPNLPLGSFDAVICCNFLEHIRDPERCISWISSVLKPGGRVFLEWPHENWKRMPPSSLLLEQGYDAYTVNFWDDRTHVDAWPMERVAAAIAASGMKIETRGRLYLPWLGDELRNHGIKDDNKVQRTYGVWLRFGLGQFVIAYKA